MNGESERAPSLQYQMSAGQKDNGQNCPAGSARPTRQTLTGPHTHTREDLYYSKLLSPHYLKFRVVRDYDSFHVYMGWQHSVAPKICPNIVHQHGRAADSGAKGEISGNWFFSLDCSCLAASARRLIGSVVCDLAGAPTNRALHDTVQRSNINSCSGGY